MKQKYINIWLNDSSIYFHRNWEMLLFLGFTFIFLGYFGYEWKSFIAFWLIWVVVFPFHFWIGSWVSGNRNFGKTGENYFHFTLALPISRAKIYLAHLCNFSAITLLSGCIALGIHFLKVFQYQDHYYKGMSLDELNLTALVALFFINLIFFLGSVFAAFLLPLFMYKNSNVTANIAKTFAFISIGFSLYMIFRIRFVRFTYEPKLHLIFQDQNLLPFYSFIMFCIFGVSCLFFWFGLKRFQKLEII